MTYNSSYIPDNHISYRALNEIKALLKPLTSKYGIHYFNFTVSYPDKSGFTLHTNADFYHAWFSQEFPMCQFSHQSGWYFWDHCSSQDMIETAKSLGIGKGILHIDHSLDKSVTLAFATKENNVQSEAFLMNNLNLLKGFGAYFENEAKKLIQEAQEERISYTANMCEKDLPLATKSCLFQEPYEWSFGPLKQLSKRERQCFILLIKGHSMMEISSKLELSPSSVNMYIARVKQKLKCENRFELTSIAERFGIVSSPDMVI